LNPLFSDDLLGPATDSAGDCFPSGLLPYFREGIARQRKAFFDPIFFRCRFFSLFLLLLFERFSDAATSAEVKN